MSHSRRHFLGQAFKATVSAAVLLAAARVGLAQKLGQVRTPPPINPLDIPLEAQKDPVFLFTESTFKPYLGGIFTAPNARGEAIELRLIKVQANEHTNRITKSARTTESFSLTFKAAAELPPFTSIHTISHPALGSFDLFLSPGKDKDKGELFYEAVITHVR